MNRETLDGAQNNAPKNTNSCVLLILNVHSASFRNCVDQTRKCNCVLKGL